MLIQQLTSTVHQHQMTRTKGMHSDTQRQISTGLRINSVSDDSANSGISSRMTTQINGYNQGRRNASDALMMVNTYNDGLSQVTDILNRLRELAIQSSNGVYSDKDRGDMNQEFQTIMEEIDRISEKTKFNGLSLFARGNQSVDIVLSGNQNDSYTLQFKDMNTTVLFPNGVSIEDTVSASEAITRASNAIEYIIQYQGELSVYGSNLNSHLRQVLNTSRDLSDTRSRLQDANVAEAISEVLKQEILDTASLSNLSKVIQTTKGMTRLFA